MAPLLHVDWQVGSGGGGGGGGAGVMQAASEHVWFAAHVDVTVQTWQPATSMHSSTAAVAVAHRFVPTRGSEHVLVHVTVVPLPPLSGAAGVEVSSDEPAVAGPPCSVTEDGSPSGLGAEHGVVSRQDAEAEFAAGGCSIGALVSKATARGALPVLTAAPRLTCIPRPPMF